MGGCGSEAEAAVTDDAVADGNDDTFAAEPVTGGTWSGTGGYPTLSLNQSIYQPMSDDHLH
jgi:hypothetical protein